MELDRISNLPGDVTENVLSRLPIKEAVRTSALSTTSRHKWAMLRHLVFDDLCISRGRTSNKTLKTIVDHVLLLHSGPVDAVRLCTWKRLDSSSVDRWILHLLRNSSSIKEFILKLMWNKSSWVKEDPYNISSCLFLYPELTHLELTECLVEPPATFKGFPRLKSLDIQNVTVAQDVLEKLIVLCPLLEKINLCDLKDITLE